MLILSFIDVEMYQTPTFLLRYVEPQEVIGRFKRGYYATYRQRYSNITPLYVGSFVAQVRGTDPTAKTYSFRDHNNVIVTVATTNHHAFEFYTRSGGDLPQGGRCYYCLRDFKETALGVPINMQQKFHMNNQERYICFAFWTDDNSLCRFECLLKYVRREIALGKFTKESETWVLFMHKMTFPDAPDLVEALDFTLLAENGGSLSENEYYKDSHRYTKMTSYHMIPAKTSYNKN